jgi:hypothetical protein
MHTRKAIQIRNHSPLRRIENDQLIGVHVRDVQTSARWIEALVVEANRRPGHRHIRDFLEYTIDSVGRLAGRKGDKEKGSQAANDARNTTIDPNVLAPHP